jgi:copper chaperone CopZ
MRHSYAVAGMTCDGCASAVGRVTMHNHPILAAGVDLSRAWVTVTGADFTFGGVLGT